MKKACIAAVLAALVSFGTAAHAAKALSGKLNLNTATLTELTLLPGIGEARAEAILAQRKAKPFSKKEEILLIKGVGDKLFAKMQPYLAVDGATTLAETAPLSKP
jgi:competence protein ComEA